MHNKKDKKDAREAGDRDTLSVEELRIHVRSDLYRAFRRCVWITVNETGMTPLEVQNMLIEELLKMRGC